MDIAFHYFAVKTLAHEAGFDKDEAQRIAMFSQYFGDYFLSGSQQGGRVDLDWLASNNAQRLSISPFHYIPKNRASIDAGDMRCVPATLWDRSFISNALASASEGYRQAKDAFERCMRLMQVGMMLHTFADTWAHQLFSGYDSPLNSAQLICVENNVTGLDQTAQYGGWIDASMSWLTSKRLSSLRVGHMAIRHVPDLSHLTFEMRYPLGDVGFGFCRRNNTTEFLQVGRQVLDYLRWCRGLLPISNAKWKPVSERLSRCFLVDISEVGGEREATDILTPVWEQVFGHSYHYDHTEIFDGIIGRQGERPLATMFDARGTVAGEDAMKGVGGARGAVAGDGGVVGAAQISALVIAQIAARGAAEGQFPGMEPAFYRFMGFAEYLLTKLYGARPWV
jgi:hypothetical protein